ncbi:MAG TPA: phage tail protein [Tahibacter sp.]|jgi:phage tail-like protein|uniref:phage tail protein n=1 Tax=Tahibacter sp. TaxID=2056211 RepID=UPI002CF156D9|nr:phage tail protein [Tahibacter sp.]HSX63065.1 phage tail protein [Tahibacter sp.]
MPTDIRIDPFRGFNFRVEIDGLPVAAFSEVGGLTAEGDPVDYREGTDLKNSVRKLPALRKYAMLSCKRGYVQDDTLWRWYQRIANGENDRRNGSIVLMNEAHRDVMRWNFENGWINKIEGPSLNASGNEVAIEAMEICHEALTFELETA